MFTDDIIVDEFFLKKKKEFNEDDFYNKVKEIMLSHLKNETLDIPKENDYLLNPNLKGYNEEKDFYIMGYEGVIHSFILEIIRNNSIKEKEFLRLKKILINNINNNKLEDIDSILIFELRNYDFIKDKKMVDELIHYYIISKLNNDDKVYNTELEEKLYQHYGDIYTRIRKVIENLSI